MDINELWNSVGDEDVKPFLPDSAQRLALLKSTGALYQLKRSLIINLCWAMPICILYAWVLLKFDVLIIRILISIVALFTIWVIAGAIKLLVDLQQNANNNRSMLAEMEYQHKSISWWLRAQELVGIFIYPVSATGGFFVGGIVGSGKPLDAFMQKPIVVAALIISILVLTPFCYWMNKKLIAYSFGKHLKDLKRKIDDLKSGI